MFSWGVPALRVTLSPRLVILAAAAPPSVPLIPVKMCQKTSVLPGWKSVVSQTEHGYRQKRSCLHETKTINNWKCNNNRNERETCNRKKYKQ